MAEPEGGKLVGKQQELEMWKRLRERGLTAAPNFSCCHACGIYEVDMIRRPMDFGYVFYDFQSALKIQDTGKVSLGFGPYPEINLRSKEEIARMVVEEAERAGMQVDWSGSTDTRIELVNLRKEDYKEPYEILTKFDEARGVVRTQDGRVFPMGFGKYLVNHTCGGHCPDCVFGIPPGLHK